MKAGFEDGDFEGAPPGVPEGVNAVMDVVAGGAFTTDAALFILSFCLGNLVAAMPSPDETERKTLAFVQHTRRNPSMRMFTAAEPVEGGIRH